MPPRRALKDRFPETDVNGAEAGADADLGKLSLGYQVRYVYRAFVRTLAGELSSHGITTSQWSALRVLWEAEGITQVELAQRMMVEKASLTSVLAAMEASHLITRKRNPQDRRKVNILLTAAGSRMKDRVLPIAATINKRATRGLSSPQARELQALLGKVMANLGA